jgi:hypothetical protein
MAGLEWVSCFAYQVMGERAMKIRRTGPLLLVLVAGGASAPVLADCCSSFWSCAATVVTEGVSCEVQTIIDTITGLVTEVTNFGNDLTGVTNSKEQAARQYVSDTINNMQSQSQQSAADLAAALSQAKVLYQDETVILPVKSATVNTQNLQAVSPTTVSGATPSVGGAPASMTTQRRQAVAPTASATAPANPMLQKSTITAATAVQPSALETAAPHGAYADAFSRGVKQLTAMQSTGSADLSKVNQYLAQAQSSEGPGVAAADTLAGVLSSPVTSILSQLSAMLTHPLDAFDPSSMVDDMEKTLTTAMSADIPQMIADITAGPQQAFDSSGPSFDDLQATAESAQQLAAAMANLYRLRNTTSANALYALLPQVSYAGLATKATTRTVAANFGQRLSYASIAANNTAAKKKLLVVAMPASMAKIHTLVAQFKTQRAQGKAPIAQALMVNYTGTLSSQLNGYFSGKSPAAIASERDQLIAQARTKYAADPTTTNGVIALLNSEAAKRGATTTATATITPIPSVRPQVGAVAPVNPAVSKSPTATWGAAPAWTPAAATAAPPTATGASSTFKTTTSMKTLQPIQQQGQQPAMQTAPSSLGR